MSLERPLERDIFDSVISRFILVHSAVSAKPMLTAGDDLMPHATLELTRYQIADTLGAAMTSMFASFY
jgi:hypothetical protein